MSKPLCGYEYDRESSESFTASAADVCSSEIADTSVNFEEP